MEFAGQGFGGGAQVGGEVFHFHGDFYRVLFVFIGKGGEVGGQSCFHFFHHEKAGLVFCVRHALGVHFQKFQGQAGGFQEEGVEVGFAEEAGVRFFQGVDVNALGSGTEEGIDPFVAAGGEEAEELFPPVSCNHVDFHRARCHDDEEGVVSRLPDGFAFVEVAVNDEAFDFVLFLFGKVVEKGDDGCAVMFFHGISFLISFLLLYMKKRNIYIS